MKMPCEMIEDLLPLYVDNVCSQESRQAVQQHLRQCEKCRKKINDTQILPIPFIEPDTSAADRAVKKGFQKIRVRWWATIIFILALVPIAFLAWNEYSGRGIAYTNQNEVRTANRFMDHLVAGRYDLAYNYLDIEDLKQEWLSVWFSEETLATINQDAKEKFCELGKLLDEHGGIRNREYIGIALSGEDLDGTQIYSISYRIEFAGKKTVISVHVSKDGVESFTGGGSFLKDPLAQFAIWEEYLWQDYEGCYFDPETKQYVYYENEQ